MVDIQPSDAPLNGVAAPLAVASSETVGSKRQRRPSWKHQPHLSLTPSVATATAKSSKTRALTNLSTDFNANNETVDNEREPNNNTNLDAVAISSWRVKDLKKRGPATKREKYSGGEDNYDFELENSESPMKDHSPIHSLDNLLVDGNEREVLYHGSNHRRPIRTRVSDGVELSGPSDTEMRRCEEDGVRIWLNSLGLGRYAPVFKIHEVDDEILPLLTLEDLKDMGINAKGNCLQICLGENSVKIEAEMREADVKIYMMKQFFP
ncbi:hypothetical protein GOBAR_AA16040 [Gossypium barbadense]|uniref:SAM domain-containing protein n=1 Tax=Gossypium barbadense TaxID=3634 RepID=A0A2P5XMN1_GOSBA|nr:hypothetical protein GOBAR_AA16040 [Gossypium barbadense]